MNMANPGCGVIATAGSWLASVHVGEVTDHVPLPPGALAETGAQIFRQPMGGIGGLSGRRSGVPCGDVAAKATGADNAIVPVHVGEMADRVLSMSGALVESSDKVFDKSRGGADPSSRHPSVVATGVAVSGAGVHDVTTLARLDAMASQASSRPKAKVAKGAPTAHRPGDCAPAMSSFACGGAAAKAPDSYNARTTTANASGRLPLRYICDPLVISSTLISPSGANGSRPSGRFAKATHP